MRYVILGAGAIGGGIGGRLALAGQDVTLVARGRHLDALRAGGLELRSPSGPTTVAVRAVATAGEAGLAAGDVVILAVKSQDTAAVLAALATAAGRDIVIVCAQNGVDNERQALRYFGRVYGMCVVMPATHLEPGVVDLKDDPVPGVLDLGRYPSGIDGTATSVAADLTAAGFASIAHPAIMTRKHRKLLANLANVLDAAAGPAGRRSPLAKAAREEAMACFEAAGVEVGSEEEDRLRREPLTRTSAPMANPSPSSSWQSLARGAPVLEADFLNGEIVLLGRQHGVRTPVNEALVGLADRLVRDQVPPGSVSEAELEALTST